MKSNTNKLPLTQLQPGFSVDENKRSETSKAAKLEGRSKSWDPEDIGVFKPERWLVPASSGKDTGLKYEFDSSAGPVLAFGLGVRSCFGKRLAYLELRILLTVIIWYVATSRRTFIDFYSCHAAH